MSKGPLRMYRAADRPTQAARASFSVLEYIKQATYCHMYKAEFLNTVLTTIYQLRKPRGVKQSNLQIGRIYGNLSIKYITYAHSAYLGLCVTNAAAVCPPCCCMCFQCCTPTSLAPNATHSTCLRCTTISFKVELTSFQPGL